ncbi:hypothetical protein LCGC14_0345690 [marine sediment metagenome]|uniref:Right handed beta helix domain-containing protein n=1 Tax=marine sediment metagenome TaxID=412755 RepID=A0A0F9TV34_9ZZZZ
MKRLLFIIVILAMCVPVHALTYNAADRQTFNNGYQWGGHPQKDRATIWAQEIQAAVEVGGQLGLGKIWYVNSGRSVSGDGKSFSRAVITLKEADVLSLADGGANRGDYIMLAQNHGETLSAADAVDLTTAGITVIGIGKGTDMPTFTYEALAGEFVVGAANIVIYNLRFVTGTEITMGISVEAAGDNCTIIACEWPEPAFITDAFLDAIDLAAGANDFRIYNCIYRHTSTTGPNHFIEAGNGANNNMKIVGNDIQGEFAISAIWSDTVDEDAVISRNIIRNKTAGQHAIEFTAAATGLITYNTIATNATATSIDPGSMMLIENYVGIAVDVSGTRQPPLTQQEKN